MTQDQKTPKPPAASAPTASARRFLAQLMEYCFREGWRTPDDFVKHFPAASIMAALKSAPDLRVAILAAATGIYEEILRRKSPALAAEDLSLALAEGTTSSMQLLAVFSPEDRVRYLDTRKIWEFLTEDEFFRFDPEATDEQRHGAAERMSYTLTQALQERLLTLRDVLDGLTYEAVADSLSPEELRTVVRHALVRGRDGIGLNEKVLLEVLPLDKLVRSMPLEHIWNQVIVERLALPNGWTDLTREERRVSQSERPSSEPRLSARPSARPPSRPSAGPPPLPAELRSPPSSNEGRSVSMPPVYYPPEPVTGAHEASGYSPPLVAGVRDYTEDDEELTTAAPPVSGRDGSLLPPPPTQASPGSALRGPLTDDFNHPLPQLAAMSARQGNAPAFGTEDAENMDRQRQRVTEHLRAIGRLPPRHATLPASVLRSIDAMYALLPSATDDIQRKSVMRQAFANEGALRVALLGLIELMDSSVDTSDPVIQEAKIEALIKILLFEEQRRKENGRFPAAPFGAPRLPSSSPPVGLSGAEWGPGSLPPPSSERGGYYFPPPAPESSSGAYAASPRVATQRPPPPVLGNQTLAGGSAAPLPNLPAEPRRRTVPPRLPPSYPRG
jgi:hypothetical protein